MSVVTQQIPIPPEQPDDTYRFTAAQFDRMVQSGALYGDDSVKLVELDTIAVSDHLR
jgi:hypothetical protein